MTNWNKKRAWPLKAVVDRQQVFVASAEYQDGYIAETLSCGHTYRDPVDGAFGSKLMRRCRECWLSSRVHQRRAAVRRRLRRSV